MDSSKLMKKIWNKMCDRIVVILAILSACFLISGCNSSSELELEPKAREPIGYAVVNGERYDIIFYSTTYGHPYVKTIDGMEICGAGITVFILND